MEKDKKLFAFVLMPFDESFDDVYRLGIKVTASELGIVAERVDEQIYNENILSQIYRQIDEAEIIIADMSTKNPNVFYEVGYAHAKQKLCILLTKSADDIPFDLKHRRHIIYSSVTSLKQELTNELDWAKKEVIKSKQCNIDITKIQATGFLNKDDYSDEGEITVKVDFENKNNESSPDIEGLYFYCSHEWNITQDGKQCPNTNSDLKPYSRKTQVNLPTRKLSKGAWTQISIEMKKTLWSKWRNQERKDKYDLSGTVLFRFITSKGIFDFERNINVSLEFDDIPF